MRFCILKDVCHGIGPVIQKTRDLLQVVQQAPCVVSYESNDSVDYDRFIEVKAASRDTGFFWSRNEYEMAKLKGEHYYLYLVDVGQIDKPGYVPKIIQNPAESVMESSDWMVEPQSYHIYHV